VSELEISETVVVVGSDGRRHNVPAHRADDFHDGKSGLPLSDDDYDEMQRRLARNNIDLVPEEFRPKEES
jgi:hypothetical protein